ncbi:hypothetical protein QBC47DRAFT_119777 [Echria macrotheca]|uniref:Uncharacterized protein n=1 Tax=Echria macrotheca TaxID=438768 RepID=A0AAJ0B2Q7_9PEZI|nr:hypothetical protein QBC47DRAFT_119777 [Echria macrotheca]
MQTGPLSPTPSSALNSSSTPSQCTKSSSHFQTATAKGDPDLDLHSYSVSRTTTTTTTCNVENEHSSPFMSQVVNDNNSPRGPSPPKTRPMSRVISGSELSPLKILQQHQPQPLRQSPPPTSPDQRPADDPAAPAKAVPQSPRKLSSPIRRFPVKVSALAAVVNETPTPRPAPERQISLQDAIRDNEGLKHAIEIFEDEGPDGDAEAEADDTMLMGAAADDNQVPAAGQGMEPDIYEEEEPTGMDDTMISTFSTFSSVPNMTMLAHMRSNSPTKFSAMGGATPRAARTPRGNGTAPDRYETGNTTNLLDFTEQLRFGGYPLSARRGNPSPGVNGAMAATPQRQGNNLVNLLDFDIPPMPTPRSIPTVTPRELESLKSGFLSEISSLKASLSGKEAEVLSLKTAVGDAEKRVGECMEQLREIQGSQGSLQAERDSWEKRGREMEVVLRKVKEEIVLSQREREELEFKLDESEKRREAAEMMAQDAESKMAGMRAGKASAEAAAAAAEAGTKSPTAAGSNKEVEIAVERVARELHALYKSKHETKVAALKKSYENRWDKKVRELQAQVDDLAHENEELRVGRDATMTKVDLARLAELEDERKAEKAKDAAHIKELEAEVEKLEAVIKTIKDDNAELRVLLERERVEKGELVILAEEMMNMQTFVGGDANGRNNANRSETEEQQQPQQPPTPSTNRTPKRASMPPPRSTPLTARSTHMGGVGGGVDTGSAMRLSTGRTSGLKAPGSVSSGLARTGSKIGRVSHERAKSTAIGGNVTGVPRPGSGMGMRSGIMSSIEKMGSYRGAGGGRAD